MPKATIVVTADNKLKKGLDPAKQQMLQFQNMVQGVEKKINKAFSIAGVATVTVAAFKKMAEAAKQCINEYSEAEKVFKRLEAVWDNVGTATGKTYQQIMSYADAIEKQTYFTGEAIEESALLLAATESLTEEGFQRALDVSIDLAAALGEDVTSAAQTLSKAIQEPESALSRLKSIGVSFTDDEKALIKELTDANKIYEAQAIILDKVEEKYQGVAKAINNTPAGKLDNIRDTLGDIRENLGGALLDSISPALDALYTKLQSISNWVAENTNSRTNEIKTGITKAARKGTTFDLSQYSVNELLAAVNSANYNSDKAIEFFGVSLKPIVDSVALNVRKAVFNELTDRGYSSSTTTSSSGSQSPVTTEVEDALTTFFNNYLGSEGSLSVSDYKGIIEDAKLLINDLVDWQDEGEHGMISLLTSVDKFNLKTSKDVNNAFVNLNRIITDSETKINEIYDSIGPSATLTMTQSAFDSMFRDDSFSFNPSTQFGFTGQNIKNNNPSGTVYTPTFVDEFVEDFGSWMKDNGWGNEDQTKSASSAVTQSFSNILGEAGELVSNLAQNMATMGPELGAIVTALNYVIEGLGEVLGDTLNEVAELLIEPFREIGRVVGNVLMPILDAFMPALESVSSFLIDVFDAIGAVLEPIANIIGMAITPVLKVISGVLEFILPFIQAIGNALIAVFSTIEWFMQWVEYLLGSVGNWLANIHVGSWYPFRGFGGNDATRPTDLGTHLQNSLIDMSGDAGNSASTDTAISSASYRGATQVTINIYQMSPVVGENGMRQFAQMIRDEFDALDYYGVSA